MAHILFFENRVYACDNVSGQLNFSPYLGDTDESFAFKQVL